MSDETIGELYVTQTVNGTEVKFRKLTPYDRRDILRKVKAGKRASLLQDLRDVQADKGEMLAELRAFDDEEMNEADFIRYVNTPDGKADVLDVALRELPTEQQQAVRGGLTLSPGETLELVAKLCNLFTGSDEGSDPNAGSPATPTEADPDTYSKTPTTPNP